MINLKFHDLTTPIGKKRAKSGSKSGFSNFWRLVKIDLIVSFGNDYYYVPLNCSKFVMSKQVWFFWNMAKNGPKKAKYVKIKVLDSLIKIES